MLSKYAFKGKEFFTLTVYRFLKEFHPNTLRISKDLFYTDPQRRSQNSCPGGQRPAAPALWSRCVRSADSALAPALVPAPCFMGLSRCDG